MQDPIQAERFLRAAITASVLTFIPLTVAVGLGYWSLSPAAIASLGVIVSFGVHLNGLLERYERRQVNASPGTELELQ